MIQAPHSGRSVPEQIVRNIIRDCIEIDAENTDAPHDLGNLVIGDADEIEFACHRAVERIIGVRKPGAKSERPVIHRVAGNKSQGLGLGPRKDKIRLAPASWIRDSETGDCDSVIRRGRIADKSVTRLSVNQKTEESGAALTQNAGPGRGRQFDVDLDWIVIDGRDLRSCIIEGIARASGIRRR